MSTLTHFDGEGQARMVDVSAKGVSLREATASAIVRMAPATLRLIRDAKVAKGDVFAVARLAGIMAAKKTGELIPLCHPIGLDGVEVGFEPIDAGSVRVTASARVLGRTGVEMEALAAVTVAALTIYDMCKSVDREIVIDQVRLESKRGGRSGEYHRGATRVEGDAATGAAEVEGG